MANFSFEAIGTRWEIETPLGLSGALCEQILKRIETFDSIYSRFREGSLISYLASAPGGADVTFPPESESLFKLYDTLHLSTDGAVDPLVGRALERLGYDKHYSFKATSPCGSGEDNVSWSKDIVRKGTSVITQRPVVIDVGAAGKGFLIDIIFQILSDSGVQSFVIDGSGDMRHRGDAGIKVGLEHPFDPKIVLGIAQLKGKALCASAVNRRAWGDGVHHILDARTGVPVSDVVATWVIAGDAATADGLATALFFVDQDKLAEKFTFSFVRMFADGRAESSADFEGELFF